eukprot:COSAG02_NODE_2438_length_8864_cov_23.127781_4_plen_126_part_00
MISAASLSDRLLAGCDDFTECLIAVSHSQDFLNAVCNRIIWIMADKKLMKRYSGNYARFVQITDADSTVQMRAYEKQQMDIAKLDDFIRKNSANKATYKSAQSKQKVLDKIMDEVRYTLLGFFQA